VSTAATPPWGLSPAEAETLQAIIDTGNQKLAARKRGVSVKTIEAQFGHAMVKSGLEYRVLVLIQFDRRMRGAA
jgi:DNA-binding CsgD family transcriptional regulator